MHKDGDAGVCNYLQGAEESSQSSFHLEGEVRVLMVVWVSFYQSFDSVDVFDVLLSQM